MKRFRGWYYRFAENVHLALLSIRSNLLRSVLTMVIVALGIMSLMGMLTVMDAMVYSMQESFGGQQGAPLLVKSWEPQRQVMGHRQGGSVYRDITYREAVDFCHSFSYAECALRTYATRSQMRRGSKSTRPMLRVLGVSDNFFRIEQYSFSQGRGFSEAEAERGANVLVVGEGIVESLFDAGEPAVGARVQLGSSTFNIVGVLASTKVSQFDNGSMSNAIYMPVQSARHFSSYSGRDYVLLLKPHAGVSLEECESNAEFVMRQVRGLELHQENNFVIERKDSMFKMILKGMSSIGAGVLLIGIFTLVGSAIGLMNIMLTSVTERIREIGTRKALGAYSSTIRSQFLIEAVMITLLGGVFGIILGIVVGWLVALGMGIFFVMPWLWTFAALFTCVLVGVLAGYLPAKRAAALDPIIALRHE